MPPFVFNNIVGVSFIFDVAYLRGVHSNLPKSTNLINHHIFNQMVALYKISNLFSII